MSSYVHFTNEQKEQARQIDLCDLLQRQGEYLKKSGREWQWRDGPEKVTIRGNLWFHQYEQVGGDAIDFVRRFYNKSYPEAMDFLLGGQLEAAPNSHSEFVRNNSYVPAFSESYFNFLKQTITIDAWKPISLKPENLTVMWSIPLSETG